MYVFFFKELITSNMTFIIHRSQFVTPGIEMEIMFYNMHIKTLFETRSWKKHSGSP